MGRLIVEQIVSADGYAAEPDGGIGFFQTARGINDVDKQQIRMLASVSAIVLGRRTYGMFASYWPDADPARMAAARIGYVAASAFPLEATPEKRWNSSATTASMATRGLFMSSGVMRPSATPSQMSCMRSPSTMSRLTVPTL